MKRKKNILEKTETVKEKRIESIFYRLIFVGDTLVGKTQIINRYINDLYQEDYFPTFSVDFKIKTIKINGRPINIHCIDTEGLSDFSIDTGTLFVQKTDAFIYVFDITSRESLNNLNICSEKIKSALTDLEKKLVYLVGNKCDLSMNRQVAESEGRLEATKYNAKYFEVSAKSGMNIDKLFDLIIQDIIRNKDNKMNFDGGGGIKYKNIYNNNNNKNININNTNNNNIDVKINNINNNNIYTNNLENENGLDYDNSSYFLKSKMNGNYNNYDNNDYVKNINNFYSNDNKKGYQNSNVFSNNQFNKCQIF